mmetsp:Transcript_18033/g.43308  ORF Transcript_18033/g.43308 Transcript_18033/m.43308 type:complete len:212 (-) Transcript_18033:224-859(-)
MNPASSTPTSSGHEDVAPGTLLMVSNPDGSMATGAPSAPKGPAPAAAKEGLVRVGARMYTVEDFLNLYERHLLCFAAFALFQLMFEVLCLVRKHAAGQAKVARIHHHYPALDLALCRKIFLWELGVEVGYLVIIFFLAVLGWFTGRPRHFQVFGDVCLVAALAHLALASAHVVALSGSLVLVRLGAGAYSRYLRHLGQVLRLHRQPAAPEV